MTRVIALILYFILSAPVWATDNEVSRPSAQKTKTYELPGINQKAIKKILNAKRIEIEYAGDQKCWFDRLDADWNIADSLLSVSVDEVCSTDSSLCKIRVYSSSLHRAEILVSIPAGCFGGMMLGGAGYFLVHGREEGEWANLGALVWIFYGTIAGAVILPMITEILGPGWETVYRTDTAKVGRPRHWH